MSSLLIPLSFDQPDLALRLRDATPEEIDALGFGVIGVDDDEIVRLYNRTESQAAGLAPERVLGHKLFDVVAPCMDNALVAGPLRQHHAAGLPLDTTLDYVLTLRMRPTKVRLRLLADPDATLRLVLVARR